MTYKRNPSVQSVERAIDILESFSAVEPGFGVGELSRRVNLPKSTVFRLLTTLESRGFIAQNSETGLYHLGVGLIPLANSVFVYSDLRRTARPHLRSLANTLEETTSLIILVDTEIINLEQVEFRGRLVVRAGGTEHRMPFNATSAGKVIAAFLPEAEMEALLESQLPALTPATITDADTLRSQLMEVRTRGYATSFDEIEEGLHAISTPIYNNEGNVVACVSVSGPSYRLTRSRIAAASPHVIQTADQISRELGLTQEH
ncbi:MAG: IclR family transcriptional regulator [Chloroflexi bacterium]|jgi:DNA-binding IclR family transcriptional regulator|nr:IclR family transcriptional regulator [Chloroflexota bacterium]